MDLNDLYKLAGIQRSDTPAVEPQEVEQQVIEEPTVDGREDMKAMIALVSPEQLNKLVGNAPVEEDMPGENVTTKANPQEFKGTLGSPADLSLRRYLGANGMPVSMDESSVYKDITSDELSEAWNAYKINEKPKNPAFDPFGGAPSSKPNKPVFDPFGGAPGDEGDPIGEPIPEPRPTPKPIPTPGGGPEEPPKPGVNDDPTTKIPQIPMSTKIKPKDVDGDSPDEPDQGKDVFGRDKAALAKKDAIFKKYGLTPPASALFQSADLNEAMQDEEVMAIMAKHPEEVAKMKQMGDMDTNSELYMELYRYYSDEMPYGTMKARDGDPVEYIMDKLDDMGILDEQTVVEEPNEGNRFSGNRQDAIDAGEDEFEVDGKTYKVKKESSELNRLRHLAGTSESAVNEGGSYSWKNGIPDEVMAVISKHNITPDDAWQMANRDNNADIDAIMDAHNDFITRMELEGADTDDDDLYDIDFGEAFMNSPEYAKVMTMVSELCSAMGIENDREECGAGLMQYVDEGATAESEELSILKRNAGI